MLVKGRARRLAGALALCALAGVFGRAAGAHPMPESVVALDLDQTGVTADVLLPLIELEVGYGHALAADPEAAFQRHHDGIAAYLARHMSAVSPDGRPWTTRVTAVQFVPQEPYPEIRVLVRLTPPPGAPVRQFTLRYDAIVHQLLSHVTLVSVRRDWEGGVVGAEGEYVGDIRWNRHTLAIDRTDGSVWAGFTAVVGLGVHHIAGGTDHLLFLLVLLLPAPLLVERKRWAGYAGARRGGRRLVRIVTAFTVGHSITLIAGSVGWLRAPSGPVETLIALSILVSAVHAVRPIFAGREPWVAAGFGLVHGLAFAALVAEFGLDPLHATLTILGFNVGIELMQLLVVAVTMPWLLLLARTRYYRPVRVAGAVAAGVAALGWMGQRALGLPNPVGPAVDALAAHAVWIVAALALLALAATIHARRQGLTRGVAAAS